MLKGRRNPADTTDAMAGQAKLEVAARWAGRLLCATGFVAWALWLGWRISSPMHGPIGLLAFALELVALTTSLMITAGFWDARRSTGRLSGPVALPDRVAHHLGLTDVTALRPHGDDDSGEVARARRGMELLDVRRRPDRRRLAWAAVAVEGIRRVAMVALLLLVLLSGQAPCDVPTPAVAATLLAAQLLLSIGHWLLSGGVLRPGIRLRWSMMSIGAGLGDGTSRTGLPIRWSTTMATMVVLNVAVSLRGVSDRWTHGLAAMPHDERVATMAVSWWLVLVGFAALRVLPKPTLGFYGATRRLEEVSTRRLALGTTLAVALVGFVAGTLPAGLPA